MEYKVAKKYGLGIIICLLFVIGLLSFAQWYRVLETNDSQQVVLPSDTDSKIPIDMSTTANSSDSWEREFPLMDDPDTLVTYTGMTFSCNMKNGLNHAVKDWTLKITVHEECYFNGFWGGTMEFHQFRDGVEIVDAIDSNTPDLSTLASEYNQYAEPLLVHMMPGDYLVYIPADNVVKDFSRNDKTGSIIMNWYYKDDLSLQDYEFCYWNDMKMSDGAFESVITVLAVIWVVILFVYIAMIIIYGQTRKEMDSHYSGISIMAGIYDFVCMINLDKDTYHIIKVSDDSGELATNGKDINALFRDTFIKNCSEDDKEAMGEFLDVSTICSRLEAKQNQVFEYIKADGGWGAVRIISGKKSSKTILITEEDISEYKQNLKQVNDFLKQYEDNKKLRENFFDNISYSFEQLIGSIHESNAQLKASSDNEEVNNYSNQIYASTEHLHLLLNSVLDSVSIENGSFKIREQAFSIKETVDEISAVLRPFYKDAAFEYSVSIDDKISDSVCGDVQRLKQILILILFGSMSATTEGSVKLVIYGKKVGNGEELIFSVRDTGKGMPSDVVALMKKCLAESKPSFTENASFVFIKIIDSTLKKMNSKLNIVSVEGDGTEMYFSLKLKTVNE